MTHNMPKEQSLPDDSGAHGIAASERDPQAAEAQPDRLQLRALEEALVRAREELARVQQAYARAREGAGGELPELEQRMHAWLQEGLELVRKYPGRSLLAAGLCGFVLGKLLHRAS